MEHTVLVTGFGPFHEHKTNASWQSVKLLPKYSNKNLNIIVEEIPVVYECVDNIVPTLWNKHNPKVYFKEIHVKNNSVFSLLGNVLNCLLSFFQLVVHVGVSSVATGITIERVAHRSGYARTDCNGKSQLAGSCTYGSEECLRTKIDVDKLCRHLSTISKLKFCTSSNAGRYALSC